jgi:hypothetical protein
MGAITPINVTRLGEAVMDREQATADEADHRAELRARQINLRAEEIQAAREKALSVEDLQTALEMLSGPVFIRQAHSLRKSLLERDTDTAYTLRGMIFGCLVADSIEQAIAEFKTLDAAKTGDRH